MSVLTLASAKSWLNVTDGNQDSKVQWCVDAAERRITRKTGPLVSTPVTNRCAGGNLGLALTTLPALSLTSVTGASGGTLTLGDLYLNARAGTVTFNSGASFTESYYTVVYAAGWAALAADVPDDLMQAVRELARYLWTPQRGSGTRSGPGKSDTASNTLENAGNQLPFNVQQMIADYCVMDFA